VVDFLFVIIELFLAISYTFETLVTL